MASSRCCATSIEDTSDFSSAVDDGDGAHFVHRIERRLRTLFGKPHEYEGEAKPGSKYAQNGQGSEDH